jgi:hypothetical protein
MTEEQIAQLLVQLGDEMRAAETVRVDWAPEAYEYWITATDRRVEYTGRRYISITLDMPKAVH